MNFFQRGRQKSACTASERRRNSISCSLKVFHTGSGAVRTRNGAVYGAGSGVK